jgi:hypothetical protein
LTNGPYEIKKLLHYKRSGHQIEEATHRMGENFCKLAIGQRISNQVIQELKKLNSPQINDPMKKLATELNRAHSKEEVQRAKNT